MSYWDKWKELVLEVSFFYVPLVSLVHGKIRMNIKTDPHSLIYLCRFLYPIYPLICVASAAVIDTFPDFFHDKYSSQQSIFEKVSWKSWLAFTSVFITANGSKFLSWCMWQIAKGLRPLVLGFILCASHSRTFSMLNGYGAPLQIYQHLEYHEDTGPGKNIPMYTLFMLW